ncbi:hypothetical protein SUGI_0873170 [Cryptomeria japonica]|nr:hypothetical protein SUGI_0873170 [Cryptomeria japonica]
MHDCRRTHGFRGVYRSRAAADHLVSSGLSGMGYKYVNIDDCWAEPNRDSNVRLVPSHSKFPSGIKALADYVHSKGLKLGIYSDAGVHNVLAVNGSSFANCVKEATSGKFESGHDDIEIKKSGNTWVISGVGQDCDNGLKLKMTVIEDETPAASPAPAPAPESSDWKGDSTEIGLLLLHLPGIAQGIGEILLLAIPRISLEVLQVPFEFYVCRVICLSCKKLFARSPAGVGDDNSNSFQT